MKTLLPTLVRFWLLMRGLILSSYLAVSMIFYATICLIVFPFISAERRYAAAVDWCRATQWMLRAITGITYRIEGLENLPDGPAVLLSKHQSAWETLAFLTFMPRPLCFVFKRELLFIPFFGWMLGMLRMIQIDRSQGRRAFAAMIKQGRARLAEGAWVVMFPEGTRTRVGAQCQYKMGGARFAVNVGAPVIPIAHNAGRVWPPRSLIKYPGVVTVSIGKPIETTAATAEEINTRVKGWIETEMRRIDPGAYALSDKTPRRNRAKL